jgi:hypothetical protein
MPMICPNGHHVSGDFCKLCEIRIKPEKDKPQGINKVSKKRSKDLAEYTHKKKKFLAENPRCAVFPKQMAIDIHHRKGRVGSLFLDERYWLGVSRMGHKEIEDNPEWAYKMGYSLLRLEKTDDVI